MYRIWLIITLSLTFQILGCKDDKIRPKLYSVDNILLYEVKENSFVSVYGYLKLENGAFFLYRDIIYSNVNDSFYNEFRIKVFVPLSRINVKCDGHSVVVHGYKRMFSGVPFLDEVVSISNFFKDENIDCLAPGEPVKLKAN